MTDSLSRRRFLPEWTVQQAVMLGWPTPTSDWSSHLEAIEATFLTLIEVIARYQQVLVTLPDEATRDRVGETLSHLGVAPERLTLIVAACDDTWARDYGPLTVSDNGQPHLLDYRFTGWGGKFAAERDNALNDALAHAGVFRAPLHDCQHLVLEGGAVESDGQGTLLTTRHCLLNPNRNPGLDQAEIERHLQRDLGVDRVLWLDHGYLAGDDTDSHIDTLARFCDENTIAYVRCDDPADEHFEAMACMARELEALRTRDGTPYRLVPLPWPRPCFDPEDGHRLPATYANFLIINGAVLMPSYADPADRHALAALADAFPQRDIIPVDCRQVIRQHGSLHCLTMQLPVGTLRV